jgi:hypothetical protein
MSIEVSELNSAVRELKSAIACVTAAVEAGGGGGGEGGATAELQQDQIQVLIDLLGAEEGQSILNTLEEGFDLTNTPYRTVAQYRVSGSTPAASPYAADTTQGTTYTILTDTVYSVSIAVEAGSATITIGGSIQTHQSGFSTSIEAVNGKILGAITIASVDASSVISITTIS